MTDSAQKISNPRRILAVSLDASSHHLSRVIKDLSGSSPEPVNDTLAGITHPLHLTTPYYSAEVPIWLDTPTSPTLWSSSFLTAEAKEVLSVLGGLIVVFSLHDEKDLVREVSKVVKDGLGGWEWDGVGLAIGVGEGGETEEWEDVCAEGGLEFVQVTGKDDGRNEFGEKMGVARAKEALEANDWAQLDDTGLSDFGDFEDANDDDEDASKEAEDFDPEDMAFGFEREDLKGLRRAIWDAGQGYDGPEADDATGLNDDDVAKVESMMMKLQAVRDAGEGMGQEQRRRMAARAVEEVMKEL